MHEIQFYLDLHLMKNMQPDPGLNLGPFTCKVNALPTELSGPLPHNLPSTYTSCTPLSTTATLPLFSLEYLTESAEESWYAMCGQSLL